MDKVLIGLFAAAALMLGACSNGDDAKTLTAHVDGLEARGLAEQHQVDEALIHKLQAAFHRGVSRKALDETASLFTEDATLTFAGKTYTGKEEVRGWFATISPAFLTPATLNSLAPTPKTLISVDGDTAKMYFECHFANVETKQLVILIAADAMLVRKDGNWLVKDMSLSPATLTPF